MTKTNFKSFHSNLDQGGSQKSLRRKATSIQYRIKKCAETCLYTHSSNSFYNILTSHLIFFQFHVKGSAVEDKACLIVYTKYCMGFQRPPGQLSNSHFHMVMIWVSQYVKKCHEWPSSTLRVVIVIYLGPVSAKNVIFQRNCIFWSLSCLREDISVG